MFIWSQRCKTPFCKAKQGSWKTPRLGLSQLHRRCATGVHPAWFQPSPRTHLPSMGPQHPTGTQCPLCGSENPAHTIPPRFTRSWFTIMSLHHHNSSPVGTTDSPKSPTCTCRAALCSETPALLQSNGMQVMQRGAALLQPRANQPWGCPEPCAGTERYSISTQQSPVQTYGEDL